MMDLSDAPLEMSAAVASTISTSDSHPSMSVCGTGESHFIAKRDAVRTPFNYGIIFLSIEKA